MAECTVCVSVYNGRSPVVTCNECGYQACRTCVVKYITNGDFLPKCMQCNAIWTHEFISNMGGTISKRIFDHRAEVEIKKQKALLPSMMPFVQLEQQVKEQEEKARIQMKKVNAERRKYVEMLDERDNLMRNLHSNVRSYVLPNQASSSNASSIPKLEYYGKCTHEDCRGYICKSTSACGLCHTIYCKKCVEILTEDHVCNEDTLASIRLLNESSKPCPTCCAPIQKISGCNDMFCVNCKTTFCWRTAKIHENGNSNPLYYEWLRDNPSTHRVSNTRLNVFMRSEVYRAIPRPARELITSILQQMSHMTTLLNQRIEKVTDENTAFRMHDLRMSFLNRTIDEAKFKSTVKKMYSDKAHLNMLSETIPMASNIREHIFNSEVKIGFDKGLETTVEELHQMIENLNQKHRVIGQIFGRVPSFQFKIANGKLRY